MKFAGLLALILAGLLGLGLGLASVHWSKGPKTQQICVPNANGTQPSCSTFTIPSLTPTTAVR